MTHDLDDKDAAVAGRGGVDVVDAAGRDLDGAGEAKGEVGAKGIVIDGFGQGDNVEALFAQAVGGLGGAVAAQHEQAVQAQLLIGLHHGGDFLDAVLLRGVQALERVRLVPRMVPPRVRMPLKSLGFIRS